MPVENALVVTLVIIVFTGCMTVLAWSPWYSRGRRS